MYFYPPNLLLLFPPYHPFPIQKSSHQTWQHRPDCPGLNSTHNYQSLLGLVSRLHPFALSTGTHAPLKLSLPICACNDDGPLDQDLPIVPFHPLTNFLPVSNHQEYALQSR